ncbi:MAG: adenine phosphoribosyltransferase [Acidobacteriota bacterium]
MTERLKKLIRDVPDFPVKGIVFKDIMPLFQDPEGLRMTLELMGTAFPRGSFDAVAGIESRGFFFAPAIAHHHGVGFVPIRKAGKLPYKVVTDQYKNEYGEGTVEMHEDAVKAGDRVVIVDDVLATGGTAQTACRLVEKLGARVEGLLFLIELTFLDGRKVLPGYDVRSIITY